MIMEDYFKKQAELETTLCFRHPWFNLFYNWLIVALVITLFGGFVWWGMQIHTQRMADEMLESTLAAMDAEHAEMLAAAEAEEAALRASEEYIIEQEATAVAKAFYGIHRFIEKYNYSSDDLATYARCMFNRAENEELTKVVSLTGQFTGYADDNPVLAEYYNLALRLVKEWHEETIKPCDVSFQFAELTPNGIYLRNEFKADGYARRWHA
jgi:hypothetical protein